MSNNIVMAFSPRNIVGCLLEKKAYKGGGGGGDGHPRTPPPSYALELPTPNLLQNKFLKMYWSSNDKLN